MKALIFHSEGVRVLADSALARNRQPWFLPEWGGEWKRRTASALRISRLGKGIRPEFAHRYVDARTILWLAEAEENPCGDFMDGAAVIGEWIPIGEGGLTDAERQLIAEASSRATLKNGDIISRLDADAAESIGINRRVNMELDGQTVLEFNIK